jgi:biotin carboxylase
MSKNVFVVGLDDFHLELLQTVEHAERYNFVPLFHTSEIASPVDCRIAEVLLEAKRELDRYEGSVDAVIGHWDFPTSTILPILRAHCGLPGPSLETVLKCEHKYWSRLEQQKVIPDHIPRFAAVNPFAKHPRGEVDFDYPFWIKPVRAHSSFLGFKVENDADFEHAMEEARQKIKIVALPFDEILQMASLPLEIEEVDGWHCIAEEIIAADAQATVEGYAFNGEVRGYGFVDSARGGRHGSTFTSYHYPSQLPESLHRRMEEISRTFLSSIGYDRSPFNIEFFYDRDSDRLSLLEVNTRISKSHCPLFALVDGASHHQVAIKVALGEKPDMPFRQGAFAHAAKFMMRHMGADGYVQHLPDEKELERIQAEFPELRLQMIVEEGQRLSDLPMQEAYSYELANVFLGGNDLAELEQRYKRLREHLQIEIKPLENEPEAQNETRQPAGGSR